MVFYVTGPSNFELCGSISERLTYKVNNISMRNILNFNAFIEYISDDCLKIMAV